MFSLSSRPRVVLLQRTHSFFVASSWHRRKSSHLRAGGAGLGRWPVFVLFHHFLRGTHVWGKRQGRVGIGIPRALTLPRNSKAKIKNNKKKNKIKRRAQGRKKESCSGTSKVSITRNKGPTMHAHWLSLFSLQHLQSNPMSSNRDVTTGENGPVPWARPLNSPPTTHCQLGPICRSVCAGAGREHPSEQGRECGTCRLPVGRFFYFKTGAGIRNGP
jgi:hypothetical protein